MFLVLISSLFVLNCSEGYVFANSIDEFKKQSVKSQIEFINLLSKSEKFGFLQKLLPGSCFYAPPATGIKFFNDGKALNYDGSLFFYTQWKTSNSTLKIWKLRPSDPFPEEKSEYNWIDTIAEDARGNLSSLWFRFSNSKNEQRWLEYVPECFEYFKEGNFWYERFKKSLKQSQVKE